MREANRRHVDSATARQRAALLVLAPTLLFLWASAADARYIPKQYPFVCSTARVGLGQPKVDNQRGLGIPVAREDENGEYPRDGRGYPTDDAEIIGWSRNCEVDPTFDYLYRDADGNLHSLEDPSSPPPDAQRTTLTDGRTVPYVIRRERGTVNRFLYSITMLAPTSETDPSDPDRSLWNGRLLYAFDGGVAIGHHQGSISTDDSFYDAALGRGYAVIYSSGTRTNTHYNLSVGGETAVQLKRYFVERHGSPVYTVGVGGSGGGIQQYVYGQNHPGLLDGGVPQYSYSDMVTQTIHLGDCELLEYYFEVTDGANPRWHDVNERQLIQGLNAEPLPLNQDEDEIEQWTLLYGLYDFKPATPPLMPDGGNTPGLTECRRAWFGLTPLVLNPHFHNVSDVDKLAEGTDGVEWTHWGDSVNVYGRDRSGFARVPWDNVGVQYGLGAVARGAITPAEFLDMNAQVGSWKETHELVPPGCPFNIDLCLDPTEFDPWSSRQMRLSPDGGATPAPRRAGDVLAMRRAYESGMVFRGAADIPYIDWRHYLEEELDMHHSAQSFATRERLVDWNGHHDNHVIWFTDARPERRFDQTPQALEVMHEWITNIQEHPERGVAGNRPDAAVDSCFSTDGALLHAGPDVWDGAVPGTGGGGIGACTEDMPPFSNSRREAGGRAGGMVFKCHTKSVARAIADGDYGVWTPSDEERARLEEIFPTGVCDYSKPDAGNPFVSGGEKEPRPTRLGRIGAPGIEPRQRVLPAHRLPVR